MRSRQAYINQMRSYIGARDGNAKHKEIIDTYNSYLPHPRGHVLTINDAWCAATTSAAAIALGYTDIIPIECSCGKILEIAKQRGIWQERDDYKPAPGDLILFDWEDNGVGDCVGAPNHIGAVEKTEDGFIYCIEGNNGATVGECKRTRYKINNKYIRGFVCPRYDAESVPTEPAETDEPIYYVVKPGDNLTRIAIAYNTTVDAIMLLNPQIKNKNLIYSGQTIRVK